MAAIHRLASWSDNQVSTFCGIGGWRTDFPGEFDRMPTGDARFEAVEGHQGVTCKRCLKALDVCLRVPVTLPAAY